MRRTPSPKQGTAKATCAWSGIVCGSCNDYPTLRDEVLPQFRHNPPEPGEPRSPCHAAEFALIDRQYSFGQAPSALDLIAGLVSVRPHSSSVSARRRWATTRRLTGGTAIVVASLASASEKRTHLLE